VQGPARERPRFAIVGAGSVGLSLGARLARADYDVWMITRSARAAATIESDGIALHDPARDVRSTARPTGASVLSDASALEGRILLLCVRAPDTEALAGRLAAVVPGATVASAQNDVDNESMLARHFDRVLGIVVRQTCTRTAPSAVSALGRGRIVIGALRADDHAVVRVVREVAAAFKAAGFDVAISQRIEQDKWLKLCINLMSVPNALIHPSEHASEEFAQIKAGIVEEAREVLAAAGIEARSCDDGDRTLDDEIAFQREAASLGRSARRLPVYNAVWGSLRYGSPLEADRYHERILALATTHGIDAPLNRRALELVLRASREGHGPESARCSDFLAPRPAAC